MGKIVSITSYCVLFIKIIISLEIVGVSKNQLVKSRFHNITINWYSLCRHSTMLSSSWHLQMPPFNNNILFGDITNEI